MRIVFAGTPEFAVPSLRAAAQRHEVVAVYTQPDRPAGRGRGLTPSPVKLEAIARGIPVLQPETLKSPESQDALRRLAPDLMVVVAYGLILPKAVLAIPTHGCWNVHASLLPRWRGAAPIQRAIEAGDAETGVGLMLMEAGLDTGPVLLEQRTPIGADETGGQLHDRLAELGAQVLSDGLGLLRAGIRPVPRPQPAEGVTYAHKLDKAEA
ncbi:MAG: methionyl-tRNA formyltransferase, partial [Gammaproteobacteria bacterium]